MSRTFLLLTFLVLATSLLSAQKKYQTETAAAAMLPAYCDFLSLPCDANTPAELEPNIKWCEAQFGQRDFVVKRLPTAGIAVLLAEYMVKEDLQQYCFTCNPYAARCSYGNMVGGRNGGCFARRYS